MLKQAKVKLNNVSDVKVFEDDDLHKGRIDFKGLDYVAQQNMEMPDCFTYYGQNPSNLLYIDNVHYKDHVYDQEKQTVVLKLEEICNGKGIMVRTQDTPRTNGPKEVKNLFVTEMNIVQDENNRVVGKYSNHSYPNEQDVWNDPQIEAEVWLT